MFRRLAIPLAAVLLAMSAVPATAIEGGVADGDGHPNVGVLAFDIDGPGGVPPFVICSGSLISDSAFLTAAHCIIPPLVQLPPNVTWAVSMVAGTPSDPIVPRGYFPDDYPVCCALTVPESAIAYATDVVVDPLYDPATYTETTGGAHDLAVVELAPHSFPGVKPVQIAHPGLFDALAAEGNRNGPQLTIVGYGAQVQDGRIYIAGYRKTGRVSFVDATANWLEMTQTTDGLPRSAAICLGDSGSPQFLGGSNVAVAVTHGGDLGCNGISYSQRLDTSAEQAFLATYLGS